MFYHAFLQSIEHDHERWVDILEDIRVTRDPAERRTLVAQLKREVVPHMKAEERHLYPVLKQNPRLAEAVLVSIEEHHIAMAVLRELERMSGEEENWSAKAIALQEVIEHHVESEENELLGAANDLLPGEALAKLGGAFGSEQEKVREKMQEPGSRAAG
jgi:hypothetical protein